MGEQLLLPLGPVRNSELFSNYWLAHRLILEPEWTELRERAAVALDRLLEIWRVQRARVDKYGSEGALEQAFVQPVFEALGWKLFYQSYVQRRKPDYALFLDDESYEAALSAGRDSPQFWDHPALVADAKAWQLSLDKPNQLEGRREYPPEQIEWYLDRTRLDWGILTNGRLWRLVPRVIPRGKPRFQTYLEIDLPALLDRLQGRPQIEFGFGKEAVTDFFYFFLFFGPPGFERRADRTPLVPRAVAGSSEYAVGVSEDLRVRVFEALRLAIQGFLDYEANNLSPSADLPACRTNAFVLLYRLLFIMYAEDRGLLPYRRNETYTRNRCLARQRDEIASLLDRKGPEGFSKKSTAIWDDLLTLFDLVDTGHKRYEVPPYNGGLFSQEQHPFLSETRISDHYLAQVVDKLGRSIDLGRPEAGCFRVDYRDLAIRQLGSVYEGLLELHPCHASQRMKIIRSTKGNAHAERVVPVSDRTPAGFADTGQRVEPNSVYLETGKGERRATGSYYTPDHIVDRIVESTLAPLCRQIEDLITTEIHALKSELTSLSVEERERSESRIRELEREFDNRVLRLRVLDPAMGSGHFLVRACQYLAEEIATNPYTADTEADELEEDASTLVYWKRRVAESCLFGVDLNPLAVELAKLALWLETVARDEPLTFLDHHLRCGNSLVGAYLDDLGGMPGTPPLLRATIAQEFTTNMVDLLAPLSKMATISSATTEAVKEKERLLRQFEVRAAAFSFLGDLWCSDFFADLETRITTESYAEVVRNLGRPRKLSDLMSTSTLARARSQTIERAAPFHWELAFSEVFFDREGRRADAGFDAVVGNPPYDVLASREVGVDLSSLTRFLRDSDIYKPSFHGKNNLYKLFVCKAEALLRDGGRMGLIVPMSLLGDDYAVGVRRMLLDKGTFTEIHAFPQKDDPRERVFVDAKLSTVVFGTIKTQNPLVRSESFKCVRHPGREFLSDSPSLVIRADEIPLYDPANLAIVSCSQEDWTLAVRLLHGSGFRRLGDLCESFQGEVNETTDGERGYVSEEPRDGPAILRGANICMYAVREASQGEPRFLCRERFLSEKSKTGKAWHSQENRIGFQRSSPQNNFRRIIAAPIAKDQFCFDTVSYVPESRSQVSPLLLLALLNSSLLDWYFRLGSTNSKVNEYQFNNLPCPQFRAPSEHITESLKVALLRAETGDIDGCWDALRDEDFVSPFHSALGGILECLARAVVAAELDRGQVGKRDRAELSQFAKRYQQLIDRILFRMAGFSEGEVEKLRAGLGSLI